MAIDEGLARAFAPGGSLRASINLGNPLLATRGGAGEEPGGLSVLIARELARRLGLPVEFRAFEGAAASVEALRSGEADLGFFAIDPARSEGLLFSRPYLLIEGSYLVRRDSPLRSNEEVDRPGARIVVGKGSAYDLFLSRSIAQAELVRAPLSTAVVSTFLDGDYEVAAGVRRQLEIDSSGQEGLRLLPGRFMVIEQALAVPAARGERVRAALEDFVAELKSQGFLARAIEALGRRGGAIAD